MAARASTRISIRWPPAEASEPTDTLVLSLGGYYVDLRVLKSDQSIDWALAGRRIVISEDPLQVEFSHIIDSQHVDKGTEVASDLGSFTKLPNGDDFETGEMPAPHLGGKIMPYEEVWREMEFGSESGQAPAWILESIDEDSSEKDAVDREKSFCARIGKFFLAIRQNQSASFSAIRQEYDIGNGQWSTKYSIGDITGMLKMGDRSEIGLQTETGKANWDIGNRVAVRGETDGYHCQTYIVRAVI